MTNGRMSKMLGILGCIVVMVTIYLLVFVNLQFNLTGYVPLPISSTFEKFKAAYRGSSNIIKSGIHTTSHTLTDIYTGVKTNYKNEVDVNGENVTTSTLDILWYNPPEWIDIGYHNRMLRSQCTYENCRMSVNKTDLQNHAAIIFSLTERLSHVPPISRKQRNPDQVWIFFYSESPVHHFRIAYRHNNWRHTMNWSMSYNMDADIFRPYGVLETRKEIIERNYSHIFHHKTKLVAWAVSHCGAQSLRDDFVAELASYGVHIDIFGQCNNNPYKNNSEFRTLINRDYKFYLSFENSLCRDYITEKFFAYYNLDVVLIVRGGLNYDTNLPNNTFINTAHFNSAKELAKYIISVGSSEKSYISYLRQKDRYTAKHIYEIPLTPCIMCEKLNKLDENRKTFEDHVSYVHQETCWNPTDITASSQTWRNFVLPVVILTISVCAFLIVWKYNNLTLFNKRCLNAC